MLVVGATSDWRPSTLARPLPPVDLLESLWLRFRPATGVWDWVQSEILADTGGIHNPDHAHLMDANIGVLWASSGFARQGRVVLGQAEQLMFRAGGWQKARQEQQMREWFGYEPTYHITPATDEYGAPKFTQDGLPKL